MDLEKSIKSLVKRNPLIVAPTDSLGDLAGKMARQKKDIAVVMDKSGEVMGLVTSHDLFDALRTYVLGKDTLEQVPNEIRDLKVTSIMKGSYTKEFMEVCGLTGTQVCVTLSEDEKISNAVRTMSISGLDHILISGSDGIVGTLSDDDLIQAFLE